MSRSVDARIHQRIYMPCDILGILLFKDILALGKLHLADIVGPLGRRRDDQVNLRPFTSGRFSAPTERR